MMMNKILFSAFVCGIISTGFSASAENISKNTARMQAMDKITGRVSVIDVPVNGKIDFGSFSIIARSCQTRSAEEIPDSFAFIDVADTDLEGNMTNVFRGWMIASSPATNAVEHPIYDVWLLQCLDKKTDASLLLSDKQLEERNNLPTVSSAEKQKSVADKIDEMQYQDEPKAENSDNKESGENIMLEFETDEETEDFEAEADTETSDLDNAQTDEDNQI